MEGLKRFFIAIGFMLLAAPLGCAVLIMHPEIAQYVFHPGFGIGLVFLIFMWVLLG